MAARCQGRRPGGDDPGARVAGPQPGAGCLLEHSQTSSVIAVRIRVQEYLDVLDDTPQALFSGYNFTIQS